MATTVATLKGNWVTSFSGWMLFDPLPQPVANATPAQLAQFAARVRDLPPLIGGYGWIPPTPYDPSAPGSYELREGYFLVCALVRVALDGNGGLQGVMEVVRGGEPADELPPRYRRRKILRGNYTVEPDPDLPGGFQGIIQETHEGDGPDHNTWNYAFVVKNRDELEWIWKKGSYRPVIANGTFRRMHPGSA